MPALVIGNQRDPIHPSKIAEAWAQALPNARLVEVPPRYEDPVGHIRKFRKEVADFLAALN